MNVIDEFLVSIGAVTDSRSFDRATQALNKTEQTVNGVSDALLHSQDAAAGAQNALRVFSNALQGIKGAAPVLAFAGALGTFAKATYETVKSVAAADLGFQKLAQSMWVTRDTAKALSIGMEVMGATQEEIAWVPELREQFVRLRQELAAFATPVDAEKQLKEIRQIGYDFQALWVRLKMLKEWTAYFLIKYLGPVIREVKAFIGYLSDTLGKNMPQYAQRIARFLSTAASMVYSLYRAIKGTIGAVLDFVDSLPANVKKWTAVFAAVGAAIMTGPFGMMIAAIGGAMLLLQDFVYYMNGWKSSNTLAPVWKALLDFKNGAGADWIERFKTRLQEIADVLDRIANGIGWQKVFDEALKAVGKLTSGIDALGRAFDKLLRIKPQLGSFWDAVGKALGFAVRSMLRLGGVVGDFLTAISMAMEGNFKGAASFLTGRIAAFGADEMADLGELIKGKVGQFFSDGATAIRKSLGKYTGDGDIAPADVYRALKEKGYNDVAAAGIMGRMQQESNFKSADGEEYFDEETGLYLGGAGMFQWTNERAEAMREYARSTGRNPSDPYAQIDFMAKEAIERGDATPERMNGFETPEEAAEYFRRHFEVGVRGSEGEYASSFYEQIRRGDFEQSTQVYGNSPGGSFKEMAALAPAHGSYAAEPVPTAAPYFYGITQTPVSVTAQQQDGSPAAATGNSGGSFTVGSVVINVANPDADGNEIGRQFLQTVRARYDRGWAV